MELILHNSKVHVGAIIWVLTLSLGSAVYRPQYYSNSEEILENPYFRFESRKTNLLKRQADADLQELDHLNVEVETTVEPLDVLNEPANYDFEYKVHGGGNFLGHSESRRDSQTRGRYQVLLPDKRVQIVNYFADDSGYHPTITYEQIKDNQLDEIIVPTTSAYGMESIVEPKPRIRHRPREALQPSSNTRSSSSPKAPALTLQPSRFTKYPAVASASASALHPAAFTKVLHAFASLQTSQENKGVLKNNNNFQNRLRKRFSRIVKRQRYRPSL